MRTKSLTALIVDQDADSGRQLAKNIKDLFSQVWTQSTDNGAIRDAQNIKSGVIFLNLTINQRMANLELIDKLPRKEGIHYVIFGYTEGLEPEFIGHALESGIQDVFVRPFDADIIASKINLYFKFAGSIERDLSYAKILPTLAGKLSFNLKLKSVDENGFTFETPHHINKGTVFSLNNPLINEIFETSPVNVLVTKTWPSDDLKLHYLYVEPRDSNETTSAALRRFILRKV